MKNVSPEQVKRLAQLACLDLSESAVQTRVSEMNKILTYVSGMTEIQEAAILLDKNPPEPTQFRKDEPKPSLSHSDALSNAPEVQDIYFKIPAMLEG